MNTQFPNFALGHIIMHLAPKCIKKFVWKKSLKNSDFCLSTIPYIVKKELFNLFFILIFIFYFILIFIFSFMLFFFLFFFLSFSYLPSFLSFSLLLFLLVFLLSSSLPLVFLFFLHLAICGVWTLKNIKNQGAANGLTNTGL